MSDRVKPWWTERIATLEATVDAYNNRLRAEEAGHKSCAARVKELENYQTKAFSILEIYGVPKERARYVANGIEVLATRHRREVQDMAHEQNELEEKLAGWQQHYADRITNPKQRQAYLSQLEKRKERGLNR